MKTKKNTATKLIEQRVNTNEKNQSVFISTYFFN